MAGMPTNVKIENMPENEGKEREKAFCTKKKMIEREAFQNVLEKMI